MMTNTDSDRGKITKPGRMSMLILVVAIHDDLPLLIKKYVYEQIN
jgi:hypothetical protein